MDAHTFCLLNRIITVGGFITIKIAGDENRFNVTVSMWARHRFVFGYVASFKYGELVKSDGTSIAMTTCNLSGKLLQTLHQKS